MHKGNFNDKMSGLFALFFYFTITGTLEILQTNIFSDSHIFFRESDKMTTENFCSSQHTSLICVLTTLPSNFN